ncbi:MAG TPA: hypothetical protein DCL00_06060 [Opitutae bacterium]|jgi:hypothetical protein|nr:hypothetical protein [Opitutae bacterium]HAF59136.1 hypothetical protein [Opitutae bacterium]|tara:strand:+ start:447 stop:683 length:237 start_codon:yes stop_codon:yes gene_type:complete
MLSPKQTLDTYYLEARRDLLEVAALLDRYDEAVNRAGGPADDESRLKVLREAMEVLAQGDHPQPNRTELLLEHFSKIN